MLGSEGGEVYPSLNSAFSSSAHLNNFGGRNSELHSTFGKGVKIGIKTAGGTPWVFPDFLTTLSFKNKEAVNDCFRGENETKYSFAEQSLRTSLFTEFVCLYCKACM